MTQECPPGLRWRPSVPDHVFGDRRLGDLEPKLEQFAMDARGAPKPVLRAHPLDEFAQLRANPGPPWPTARFPTPIGPKPCPMPPQDRVGLNHAGQTEQAGPEPSHPDQQYPVTPTKPQTARRTPQGNIELMSEKQVLASSSRRGLNRSGTNVPSSRRIASIAPDDELILPHRANPRGWNFWERQSPSLSKSGTPRRSQLPLLRPMMRVLSNPPFSTCVRHQRFWDSERGN